MEGGTEGEKEGCGERESTFKEIVVGNSPNRGIKFKYLGSRGLVISSILIKISRVHQKIAQNSKNSKSRKTKEHSTEGSFDKDQKISQIPCLKLGSGMGTAPSKT